MDIITIDPSLTCTAVCINGTFHVYASTHIAFTKSGKLKGWFEQMEPYAEFKFFDQYDSSLPYSQLEVAKLSTYDFITDSIMSDIALNLHQDANDALVCIEGYSYSSATSAIIDLVTFSTLLRSKLQKELHAKLIVVSPSTLKVKACEFTYGECVNDKGKIIPCRNPDGISGGRFKKHEIFKALIDNPQLAEDPYVNLLRNDFIGIMYLASVPKPVEDINDSKILYELILDMVENQCYGPDQIENRLIE